MHDSLHLINALMDDCLFLDSCETKGKDLPQSIMLITKFTRIAP